MQRLSAGEIWFVRSMLEAAHGIDQAVIDKESLYLEMMVIRTVESMFLEYYSKGHIKGTVHTCLGQEACAVGVMRSISKETDVVFSSHRAHGHYIAYGGPIEGLIAEVLGKASGICGGIGGTQHLNWRNFYTNGIQGGMVPSSVGAALAEKLKGSHAISVVILGDGTMGQGTVYECFNIAALWKLPVLFVLENNQFAQTTPTPLAHSGKLSERAKGFGIDTMCCDGNDVEAVLQAASEGVKCVRSQSKPLFLVLDTYRLGPHSKGDDFRSEEELAPHRERDPIRIQAGRLVPERRAEIDRETHSSIESLFLHVIRS